MSIDWQDRYDRVIHQSGFFVRHRSTRFIHAFFFRGSLTRALFRWLTFEQFVRRGRKLAVPDASQSPSHQQEWLTLWEQTEESGLPIPSVLWLWTLVSAFFGMAAMLGLLSMSHVAGVNIWAALLLFAALPLLMVGVSLVGMFLPMRGLSGHPVMSLLVNKLGLHPFRSRFVLLIPWLQWQLQRGGLAFMVSALLTFFVFATFQDVRFVWSSTFIEQNDTMQQMLAVLAWPWHGWLDAPDAATVAQARFRAGFSLGGTGDQDGLWPFVVMAMLVYGLLPRLMLSVVCRFRLRQRLSREISRSSLPEQFFTIQQHAISRAALSDTPDDDVLAIVIRDPQTQCLVGWRMPANEPDLVWNLGLKSWQDDEQWLTSFDGFSSKPVVLVTELWQTPMGELSDCISILQRRGIAVVLMLTRRERPSDRADAQERSWRYFAQKNQIEVVGEASL
ncbi:hypothetical protein MED297_14720 [Reinekea sp. MED297]|uniref:DUF2868 domain-containing protein n=1 Tax=Reinekea blandensis MED297 TaxID=314283 RepID=A4BI58_9GAMM|nr:hypothetical protein MED297_14720 [Reinekea sp. MED297] [Reinekea blandensis MED297]